MTTTAEKLKRAEKKIAKAQEALDRTRSGLQAAEEVAAASERASRHPVLIALALIAIVGFVWILVSGSNKS